MDKVISIEDYRRSAIDLGIEPAIPQHPNIQDYLNQSIALYNHSLGQLDAYASMIAYLQNLKNRGYK